MGVTPIDTAKDWLEVAEIASDAKKYEQSLYALEMSVEIAFKAVLMSVNVEAPKVHDIRRVLRTFLIGNKSMPKAFTKELDGYISTFEDLLRLRPFVGYGFENGAGKKMMEEQAKAMLPKCAKIVSACEDAIGHVQKKK